MITYMHLSVKILPTYLITSPYMFLKHYVGCVLPAMRAHNGAGYYVQFPRAIRQRTPCKTRIWYIERYEAIEVEE